PRSGTKAQIRERVVKALHAGSLSLDRVVLFLDEVVPWGKQHVFLFQGPTGAIADWRNKGFVADLLKQHRLGKYLNAAVPVALPEKMRVSSIMHDRHRLRITAIRKRDWWERNPDLDESRVIDHSVVNFRAFLHCVTRSLVAFDWDLAANTAFLQIAQLPSGSDYAQVAREFLELVDKWLDVQRFSLVDLRPAIKKLHELEDAGTGGIRSHGIDYRTLEGRRFAGRSASPSDPLLGEPEIDSAMRAIRDKGLGHTGNFYWLPGTDAQPLGNPLDSEMHVIIVAYDSRINFPTPNDEQTVRHVLSRIRSYCS
ncbi:MAG TPA: hypothetical protein P5572_12310, partial [Phycisphaerae bacterium]|nr:hypothetical protein [Phycisphaerae bacterium]